MLVSNWIPRVGQRPTGLPGGSQRLQEQPLRARDLQLPRGRQLLLYLRFRLFRYVRNPTFFCSDILQLLIAGKTCNTPANSCSPNPCQNNGECKILASGRRVCVCTQSFKGPTCATPRSSCGKYFRTPQGYVEFPVGTGNKYDHGLSCAWVIITNHTLVLNVTFTKFALEGSTGDECTNDYVQVFTIKKSSRVNQSRSLSYSRSTMASRREVRLLVDTVAISYRTTVL